MSIAQQDRFVGLRRLLKRNALLFPHFQRRTFDLSAWSNFRNGELWHNGCPQANARIDGDLDVFSAIRQ